MSFLRLEIKVVIFTIGLPVHTRSDYIDLVLKSQRCPKFAANFVRVFIGLIIVCLLHTLKG